MKMCGDEKRREKKNDKKVKYNKMLEIEMV